MASGASALDVWLFPETEGRDVKDFYKFGEVLGTGSFSKVKRAKKNATGEYVAIKVFDKAKLDTIDLGYIKQEIDIMKCIDHPNVVKLHEVFESRDKLYIVTDLMSGGELFDRIQDFTSYTETDVVNWLRQIVKAINYLHEKGIVHRDLKPENLLLSADGPDSVIKVADFGLAKMMKRNKILKTACGTPEYAAPEVIDEIGYNEQVDMWAVGVICYLMLSGYLPFEDEDQEELFCIILEGQYTIPGKISAGARDLLSKLLVVDPNERFSAEATLNHPWVRGEGTGKEKLNNRMSIKVFNDARKSRNAVMMAVMATGLADPAAADKGDWRRSRQFLEKELLKPENRKSLEMTLAASAGGSRKSVEEHLNLPTTRGNLREQFLTSGNRRSLPLHMLPNFQQMMAGKIQEEEEGSGLEIVHE